MEELFCTFSQASQASTRVLFNKSNLLFHCFLWLIVFHVQIFHEFQICDSDQSTGMQYHELTQFIDQYSVSQILELVVLKLPLKPSASTTFINQSFHHLIHLWQCMCYCKVQKTSVSNVFILMDLLYLFFDHI